VQRLDDAAMAELARINRLLERAVEQEASDEIESLEYLFHRTINVAADSRELAYVLRSATQYLPRRFFTADTHWRRAVNRDHKTILKALTAKDPEAARLAMEAHVLDGQDRLIAHLDEIGFWTPDASSEARELPRPVP
jgi:DNA-binding GntR family transcriptional regulator